MGSAAIVYLSYSSQWRYCSHRVPIPVNLFSGVTVLGDDCTAAIAYSSQWRQPSCIYYFS
jgi:hypothetical protein